MQIWPLHKLSLLALDIGCLEILKEVFTFSILKGWFPSVVFPPLTSLPDNAILKENKFSVMLFLILLYDKLTVESVQAALNSERYAAYSIKAVSENFGLDSGPFVS